MKKLNQKGFSIGIIALVIVILGLVAVVGWLVYDRSQDKESQQASSNTEQTEESENSNDKMAADPTASWKTFETTSFSVKHPEAYAERQCDGSDDVVWLESDATGHIICNSDAGAGGTVLSFQCFDSEHAVAPSPTPDAEYESADDFSFTSVAINSVTYSRRLSRVIAVADGLGPDTGTRLLTYEGSSGSGKTCRMSYSQPEGANDILSEFEQITRTFKLN